MNNSEKLSIAIAATFVVAATILMLDGHMFGEVTTNLGRILLFSALPVFAKAKKSRTAVNAQNDAL
jgi:hypothetical protein